MTQSEAPCIVTIAFKTGARIEVTMTSTTLQSLTYDVQRLQNGDYEIFNLDGSGQRSNVRRLFVSAIDVLYIA